MGDKGLYLMPACLYKQKSFCSLRMFTYYHHVHFTVSIHGFETAACVGLICFIWDILKRQRLCVHSPAVVAVHGIDYRDQETM